MKSRHRFLLQVLLIIPPVIGLSAAALYSLRQDRAWIEQEARNHARILAPELARQCSRRVGEELAKFISSDSWDSWLRGKSIINYPADADIWPQSQCLLIDGQIRIPADYPRLPIPSDWSNQLTPAQSHWWRVAEEALFQRRDLALCKNALKALSTANTPMAARSNAEYSLLLMEARRGGAADLATRFVDLAARYPVVPTESGALVADLALLQALSQPDAGKLGELLYSPIFWRVVRYPSFLTPDLLEAAQRIAWDPDITKVIKAFQKYWFRQSKALGLLRVLFRLQPDPSLPSQIWLEREGETFMALCSPFSTKAAEGIPKSHIAWHVTLIPGKLLSDTFRTALISIPGQLPSYAAAAVQIGDRGWRISSASQTAEPIGNRDDQELAAAAGQLDVQPVVPGIPAGRLFLDKDLLKIVPQAMPHNRTNILLDRPIRLEDFPRLHPFTIRLLLIDPDLLYARYRQREWLAAGLILLATAAVLIGILYAWRTFQQQLRLNEMTSNFVSSVSHELRAPIASMRLMAESLDRGRIADDGKQKDYFRLIVQECRRLSALIENVLNFSLIHRGHRQYEFEPTQLVRLVQETIKVMEPYASERKVRLAFSDPVSNNAELQPSWDGQAIQQALVNLIDNAIKHSPEGATVKIGIEIATGAALSVIGDEGNSPAGICLWVEDQGQGVPPEEQKRIFEAFYRRGSELRRETRGVGIGLSIVKHIAEAHGGRASVRSTAGNGSRFMLELPFAAVPKAPLTLPST